MSVFRQKSSVFLTRPSVYIKPERRCQAEGCYKLFTPDPKERRKRLYCSDACKKRAYRKRQREQQLDDHDCAVNGCTA